MNEAVYLGFDYGSKKTGIAIGQTISETASPLETIKSTPKAAFWQIIDSLMIQWKPDGFVLGIPMTDQLKDHPLIPHILKFAKKLQHKYERPVYLIDERLSSHEASQQLKNTPKKRKKSQNIALDSLAAKIILETWLRNPHNHLNLETLEKAL